MSSLWEWMSVRVGRHIRFLCWRYSGAVLENLLSFLPILFCPDLFQRKGNTL